MPIWEVVFIIGLPLGLILAVLAFPPDDDSAPPEDYTGED